MEPASSTFPSTSSGFDSTRRSSLAGNLSFRRCYQTPFRFWLLYRTSKKLDFQDILNQHAMRKKRKQVV